MFRTLRSPATRLPALAFLVGLSGCVGSIGSGSGDPSVPAPGGSPNNPANPGTGSPGVSNPGGPAGPGGPVAGSPQQGVPDHVPLRRLTRSQYNNTIRDLLGLGGDPAAAFGIDEQEGGFNANSKAPLKELQIERYQQTADELAGKAVANLARIAPCAPPAKQNAACIDEFLGTFGKRAYRRPLTTEEQASYKALFQVAKNGGADFPTSLNLLIATMLQSPHFIYRPELGDGSRGGSNGVPLTPYETASRLSYFFLNSMPDDELFAAADGNKLGTVEQVSAQARRLLAKPQARETITSFHQQWLQIDDLLTVEKSATVYPGFNPELRAAMKVEVDEYVDQITRQGDGSLETLLSAKFSWLSGPLYGFYGAQGSGAAPRKVDLPAGQRGGLFTLAAVMARHSHADQSSLVGRGALISDRLLCIHPPSPPDDVDAVVPKPDPNIPTRKRFEEHRADPKCASCHTLMDPLGIPFEIYDGMGKFRTMDGGQRVDATSTLSGTDNDGPVTNAVDLMERLARTSQVRRCVTQQWFRYLVGRMDGEGDKGAIDAALAAFTASNQKVPDLLVALSTTNAFRFRRAVNLP